MFIIMSLKIFIIMWKNFCAKPSGWLISKSFFEEPDASAFQNNSKVLIYVFYGKISKLYERIDMRCQKWHEK